MKATCELVSNVVLPSIRAWIAREAVEKGMKQKDVAECLGLSRAAVSQYLSEKRADIDLGTKELRKIEPLIEDITDRMVSGDITDFELMKLICKVCLSLRSSLALCRLHFKLEPKLEKVDCTFCEELFKGYKEAESRKRELK